MTTNAKIKKFKINQLTEEQYLNAKANNTLNENELYLTTDDIVSESGTDEKVVLEVLFSGRTNENIDLSDNYENYKYLDIIHSGGTTRWYTDSSDNGICLLCCANDNSVLIWMFKRYRITSNKLTKEHAGRTYSYTGSTTANDTNDLLYVYKILGYK